MNFFKEINMKNRKVKDRESDSDEMEMEPVGTVQV